MSRYKSGAQKRKAAEDKLEAMKKLPKITSFFSTPNAPVETVSTANTSIADDPVEAETLTVGYDNNKTIITGNANTDIVTDTNDDGHDEKLAKDSQEAFLTNKSDAALSYQDSVFLPNKDPAKWPEIIKDNLIDCYLEKGAEYFHNCDSDKKFKASLRSYKSQNRKFRESMLYKILVNGETVRRHWILYSLSTGNIYCFSCKLFNYNKSAPFCCGFSDWKKGHDKIELHENSKEHRISMNKLLSRMNSKKRVDKHIAEGFQKEKNYWIDVFKRIVVVIKFLAERGLPFRGDDEIFGSTSNGLYMGMLEIIAKFDPFLDNHIKNYGNKGKGNVSSLSKTICEEFIKLMSKKVLKNITGDIVASKYFSLVVDSTPDLSHVDQLSIIIRYCSSERGGQVHERFLGFDVILT